MAVSPADRLEMRLPPEVKERLRQAAAARGQSLTRFALDALTRAANDALRVQDGSARRPLGWAAGTARELGDIVGPATESGEWDALST